MTVRIAFAIGLAVSLATPAAAGTGTLFKGRATGTMVSSWGYDETSEVKAIKQPELRAAFVARGAAACVVSKNPEDAKYLLSLAPSDMRYGTEVEKIGKAFGECMNGSTRQFTFASLKMTSASMRGLLAEAFLRSWDRPRLSPTTQIRASYSALWVSNRPEEAVVEEMASCLAETHPEEVVALIAARPGSKEESAARGQIMPYVGPCLGKGAVLQTNSTNLRLAVALGLYHRMVDPAPAPTPAISSSGN